MVDVALTINNRNYTVTCGEGEEDHVRLLAGHLDEKVNELVGSVGQIGESRLLVMASLLIADELSEAYTRLAQAESGGKGGTQGGAQGSIPGLGAQQLGGASKATIEALDRCAQRLESIAAKVEAV